MVERKVEPIRFLVPRVARRSGNMRICILASCILAVAMHALRRIQSCLVVISIFNTLLLSKVCLARPPLCHIDADSLSCENCVIQSGCSWCAESGLCLHTSTALSQSEQSTSAHCSSTLSSTCDVDFHSTSDNSNIFESMHATDHQRNYPKKTSIDYQDLLENNRDQRWVLDMINVPAVWSQGIFGQGVRVRVNDGGVDQTNPHWQDRFDVSASCDNEAGNLASSSMQHGTSVASIIGASNEADGTCTVGVAPAVTISSCYALGPSEAFLGTKLDAIDISSNSFERPACQSYKDDAAQRRSLQSDGTPQCPFAYADLRSEYDPCMVCDGFLDGAGYNDKNVKSASCVEAIVKHCNAYYEVEMEACSQFLDLIIGGECNYVGLSTIARDGIVKGITEGRGGKGIIFIFAAGNTFFEGDDTNLKGYTSSVGEGFVLKPWCFNDVPPSKLLCTSLSSMYTENDHFRRSGWRGRTTCIL